MTWYYVYAIVPAGISLPGELRGVADEPLTVHTHERISAVVGVAPEDPPEPRAALVLAHHRLVSKISQCGATLPVQFGSAVRSLENLEQTLNEQYETLLHDLSRLTGKVEFGVTILWSRERDDVGRDTPEREEPADTGAAYMRQRLAQYQQEQRLRTLAEAIQADLESKLSSLIVEQREKLLPRDEMPLRGSYLVNAQDADAFLETVGAYRKEKPGLELVVVGPWPPYSFVTSRRDDIAGMFGAKNR